jgi:hypothetical protein
VSNSSNTQPIDLPNSNGDNCCAAQWHAMADQAATMSGETLRADFARSFDGKSKFVLRTDQYCAATQQPKDSCHATNASIYDGKCNDCTNVTAPKKPVTMSNFEQRVMSRFAHLIFSKLGGSDAYKRHSC